METLCVIFGGRSGEHEVSVMSAAAVIDAARQAGYGVMAVGITKEGRWIYLEDGKAFFASGAQEVTPKLGPACYISPDPGRPGVWIQGKKTSVHHVDAVFPVLHGSFGEDGLVQGILELSGIPYVGAPTLPSAVCMDKDTAKRILASHEIPCVPAISIERYRWAQDLEGVLNRIASRMGMPLFVKPSASGSSLGVSKVKEWPDLPGALEQAFLYDTKALVEPSMDGLLEIECSVLGNDRPQASIAGQIVVQSEFYDYEAKYVLDTTSLVIPAPLNERVMGRVQELAVAAFLATGCSGMARVDFFVDPSSEEVLVSELNTIPGFTQVSMYPKLWAASGIPFPELVKRLVGLARERKKAHLREVRRRL